MKATCQVNERVARPIISVPVLDIIRTRAVTEYGILPAHIQCGGRENNRQKKNLEEGRRPSALC